MWKLQGETPHALAGAERSKFADCDYIAWTIVLKLRGLKPKQGKLSYKSSKCCSC